MVFIQLIAGIVLDKLSDISEGGVSCLTISYLFHLDRFVTQNNDYNLVVVKFHETLIFRIFVFVLANTE